MQTAKIPRSICDKLDKKTRQFIWGGDDERRKIHLLSWETLQKPRDQGGIGMRSARQANSAFLTKLGWRVLTEPNALWSRVLRHKYCKGRCDIDMFTPTTNMSNVWRGITDNVQWLKKGTSTAIGNGRHTLFWDHLWVTDIPLRSLVTHPTPEAIEGATVGEMWEMDNDWKWDEFANLLPNHILKKIAAHQVVNDDSASDLHYWRGTNKGVFSIKSALRIIRNEETEEKDTRWELAWHTPVQQRVRVFIWLGLHNRLLCNANRTIRKLTTDPGCKRCGSREETLVHIFRDCPTARHIWRAVGGSAQYPSFYNGNLSEWLTRNLKATGLIHSEKWPTCFAVTLWWIWRWRNCIVFGRDNEVPIHVGTFIHDRVEETWESFKKYEENEAGTSRIRREIYIKWLAPPTDWLSLNTDGASKGTPGPAGGGGIIRNSSGIFLQAFSANFGVCSAYKAEIMAAMLGLNMAKEMGIPKLVLQMDNEACIQVLKSEEFPGGECHHIINYCRSLISFSGWEVKIIHTFREGNKVADRLANLGVVQEEKVRFFHTSPYEISTLLFEDIMAMGFVV